MISVSSLVLQLHGQMIAATIFTAARAVDKALDGLRFGQGTEQHDGLAGRAPRHGGIGAVPDDPDGARPCLTSDPYIFVGNIFAALSLDSDRVKSHWDTPCALPVQHHRGDTRFRKMTKIRCPYRRRLLSVLAIGRSL